MPYKFFHADKPIAGIDISTTGVKAMAINPHKMVVEGYGAIDLDPNKVQESMNTGNDYLAEGMKKLFKEKFIGHMPSSQVVVSVPTNKTYSRTLSLPLSAENNLDDAIQLEVEQYIPLPANDLYIDYGIIERTKDSMTVLVSAVPKRIVDSIMHTCDAAGLEVIMLEPGINAAARLITATEEGHLPSIIIDIGAATADIALLDNVVRVTGGASVGGHTFTFKIAEKMKISLEEAHQLKVHNGLSLGPQQSKVTNALEPSLRLIAAETRKIIRYYNERLGIKTKIEQIVIVGGGSNMPGLGEFMTETMQMPARVADPWTALSFGRLTPPSKQFKPRYITAAGLSFVNPREIW